MVWDEQGVRVADVSPAQALVRATAVGGQVADLVRREPRGDGQPCRWELVVTLSTSPEDRAAAAWIIADEIMRERTGGRPRSYGKWREATLNGVKLTGKDHLLVKHFAEPVFEAAAAKKEGNHGLAGHIGEWLWYLLTRDLPQDPARPVEILGPPKAAVNDGGGDGLIVYRENGTARGFSFRLWEMKKYTSEANKPDGAIRKGWMQLSTKGATYLGMLSWGDKLLADDTREFVGSLTEQWIDEEESASGGVSVALNTTAIPTKAFHLAHEHFTTHKHPGALQGLVVAIDDLEGFAHEVREYVWTAL
ncbi:hypothetical protein ACFC34_37420 [Streptomyces sp. NPDC056053]|uniref:hypothetical protein n=1 Tax=Streptomyces sp. NPDC056053 TaxID=3345696 RepID=UPI0035DAB391